jgi:hypothetical protein
VRRASQTDIPDVTSGFRAYSREAALRLNVVSRFTYTVETIIQAGRSDLAVAHVPVHTNAKTRESRLFRSMREYVSRSIRTILRIWVMYEPLPVVLVPALLIALVGGGLLARFTWFYFTETGPTGHVQSLIVAAALLIFAVQLALLGVISDLLRSNRVIAERTLHRNLLPIPGAVLVRVNAIQRLGASYRRIALSAGVTTVAFIGAPCLVASLLLAAAGEIAFTVILAAAGVL